MNLHLKSIPGLGSFSARRFASRNLQNLGRESDRALHAEVLALGTLNELRGNLLEGLDIARSEGDADFVDFRAVAKVLFVLLVRHLG